MLYINKLFSKSPFAPLQKHIEKVGECVAALKPLFDAVHAGDQKRAAEIAKNISEAEHAADLIKNDIRNHLPKSLFLSIDRPALLEIISLQDGIADYAEDVAILATLKPLSFTPLIEELFPSFLDHHLLVFDSVRRVMRELDELVEASFGGVEAERVRSLIYEVAVKEHEADVVQRQLLKAMVQDDNGMHYTTFFLWQKIMRTIAGISNISEKLANRMRMTLEI